MAVLQQTQRLLVLQQCTVRLYIHLEPQSKTAHSFHRHSPWPQAAEPNRSVQSPSNKPYKAARRALHTRDSTYYDGVCAAAAAAANLRQEQKIGLFLCGRLFRAKREKEKGKTKTGEKK